MIDYESIHHYRTHFFTVRIWRTEGDQIEALKAPDLKAAVQQRREYASANLLARELLALPRVSAVQVSDGEDNGIVLYKDWS